MGEAHHHDPAEGRAAVTRLSHAWRASGRDQRLAALAAIGLFASMLLPWYSKTVVLPTKATQASLSAFQAFSFVEAAVLLVSAGVLVTLFARAEGRDFQLPGGNGLIVAIAGGWAALLIFYRLLDKPGLQSDQRITATIGVEWGIFVALLLALGMLYAGTRMRAAEQPQPPAERAAARPRAPDAARREAGRPAAGERDRGAPTAARERDRRTSAGGERDEAATISPAPAAGRGAAPRPAAARAGQAPRESRATRGRPRYPPAPAEQMSFEEPPSQED
jgi:hypothetical protein